MATDVMNVLDLSTRPYLLRALYEWCSDQGFTPYIVVWADEEVQVPREYVKDGQIVLNISADAADGLKIDNEWVHFHARFGGVAREIFVPVNRVIAIYARENGQGMAFPGPTDATTAGSPTKAPGAAAASAGHKIQLVPTGASATEGDTPPEPPKPGSGPGRPKRASLKRIK